MNPLKLSMIEDYVHNNKPIAGTVAKEWLRLLLAERKELFDLLFRIEKDVNEFGRLVGIQMDNSTLEEKAKAYNERITSLRSALAYYSAPSTYMVLNGIPVLQDKGERATEALTGISSTSEKLPGNPEEEANNG